MAGCKQGRLRAPVWRCTGPAGEPVVAQALPRSASTDRIVRSLSQHDEAFRRRLRWAGKHELAFLAKASAMQLVHKSKLQGVMCVQGVQAAGARCDKL